MSVLWLLVFIPFSLILSALELSPIIVFFSAALSVVPLAQLMGDATEKLSSRMSHNLAGLLNATIGTIPDIIIGIFALKHGLVEIVKASITGAIVGNLLFGLGLAITLGGLNTRRALNFDAKHVHLQGGLLLLATTGLIIPAIFDFSTVSEEEISLEVSIVLIVTYLLSVIFTLTDQHNLPLNQHPTESDGQVNAAGKHNHGRAMLVLIAATLVLAVMSEVLTDAIEPAAQLIGLTPIFTGIFLLAPVGNAAELINAVRFARSNKLDISLGTTMGASTQMALLAAPILVFMSLAMGQSMDLVFSKFQVVSIILSVVLVNNVLTLGSVGWISGAKLIATYLILGIGFYAAP